MANILEIILQADDQASGVIGSVLGSVSDFGAGVSRAGMGLLATAAPFVGALTIATSQAVAFDQSMTNTASVLGITREEAQGLSEDILQMGSDSVFGVQATADSFYDIVGGVSNADARMSILEQSMRTATAGAADLGSTTQAMIAVMNSYSFAASDASRVSDILTRTVGMGVGTMGDFASALPAVTGVANSMGISFEDVASATAFLTTQGNTASQATTQLGAMMGLLNAPTADLANVIHELGFESGQAMVDQYGLVGAFQALEEANGGTFAGLIQNQEAFRGATALSNEAFNQFSTDFVGGIEGATAAAEEIQLSSPAAQIALLQSSLGALSVEVGSALLPIINDVIGAVRPLITGFTQWLRANPQVVSTVIAVVGAVAGLGAALVGIGGVISGVAGGFALLMNPITWIIGGVAALSAAFATNFMGIRDVVQPIIDQISFAVGTFFDFLNSGMTPLAAFQISLQTAFGTETMASVMSFVTGIRDGIGGVISFITATVIPTLGQLLSWFITDGLPLAVGFVTGVVIPAVTSFVSTLANIWTTVQPFLFSLIDWFITTGLPTAVNFVTGTVVPAVEGFIATLLRVWTDVSPFLFNLFDWFVNTGLPIVGSIITDLIVPTVQTFIDILVDTWEVVSPFLGQLYDWFVTNGLPFIQTAVETAGTFIQGLINIISGIWNTVSPVLTALYDGFLSIFQGIMDVAITPLTNALTGITNTISGVQQGISGFTSGVGNFVSGIGQGVSDFFGGTRDSGGTGVAGQAYLIGTGAQPEMFVPRTDGTFLTPAQQGAMGGGSGTTINGLNIYANSYEEGQAAADGFQTRMSEFEQEKNRRG